MKNVMNVKEILKKHFMWLFLLTAFVFSGNLNYAQTSSAIESENNTGHIKPISALNLQKWEKDGLFGGFAPQDEIVANRTQNTKHFRKENGEIVAQIGGNYHYQDENAQWQDIDFTISKTNFDNFAYSNTTNIIKTYFPKTAGNTGIAIRDKAIDIEIWKNPELLIYDANKNIIHKESSLDNSARVINNIVRYQSFNGVIDEIKIIDNGIENNIIIDNLQEQWTNLSAANTISFKQFVELPSGVKIINSNGDISKNDFTDEYIGLQFADGQVLYLNPLIVFDAQANKDDAQLFYGLEEKNKIPEDIKAKSKSFYKGTYNIKFVDNGIEIYSDVSLEWLQQAQYPVTVDPTWTIGSTASGSFYGPLTHWYGYQRHASLYKQSEINGYGYISQIEYYKTNTSETRTEPTKVYMREITDNTITSTAAWNSTTYTGGLTALYDANSTQNNTVGWKAIPLSTSFNYTTGNLLVMVSDAAGGSGGTTQYMAQENATGLQTYYRKDATDGGDGSTMSTEARRTSIRITYISDPCEGTPTPGNTIASENPVCVGNDFILSLENPAAELGLTYQWQSSPDMITWTDIGTSENTLTTFIGEKTYFQCIVTCTNSGESATSTPVEVDINIAALPYAEEFNTTSTPACWEITDWTIGSTRGVTGNPGYNIYTNLSSSATTATFTTGGIGPITAGTHLFFDYITAGFATPHAPPVMGTGNFIVSISIDGGDTYTELETVNNNGVTGWQTKSYDLSTSYIGEIVKFKFVGTSTSPSANYDLAFDNFMIGDIPTCPKPKNLVADNITATSATLSWEEMGSATSWNLKISTTPIDAEHDAGEIEMTLSTNPFELAEDALFANTTYYWYVQADCGGGDLSYWSSQYEFTTECGIIENLPFTENFDTWGTGSDAFPDCWSRPVTYGTSPVYPSCVSQHSVSAPNSLRFQSALNNYTCAVTPAFAEDINNLMVSFNLRREGASSGVIQVGVMSDPNDVNTFELVETIDPSETGTWIYYEVMFNATTLSGPNNYIAFRQNPISTAWYYWLDDLTVDLIPSCVKPTDLYADNIAATLVSLNWTASISDPADGYNIYYSTSEIEPTEETVPLATVLSGITTYELTGLTDNTTYYWYVQANCGSGDISEWSLQATFHTRCEPISELPFNETFDSESPTKSCWIVLDVNNDGDTWDLDYTYNPYVGNQVAVIYTDTNDGENDDYLISPALILTGNELLTYQYRVQSSGEPNDFELLLSTTGIAPEDFTTVLIPNTSYSNTSYAMETVDLSSYTGTVYIAWHVIHGGLDGWRLYIDDVLVRTRSDENDIVSFSFPLQTGAATIDNTAKTVEIEVAMYTDLSALTPTITVSDYATITPTSGVVQNFTGTDVTPFEYTVTSESGIEQIWYITVTEATTQSDNADILSFTLPTQTGPATIDNIANTVDIEVDWLTSLGNLSPTITLSSGLATISPLSGVAQNFSSPVIYTVTAEDESTKDYTATVTAEEGPLGANCSNPFIVNIPADLIYQDLGQTNCGLGHVYDDTNISHSSYDNGEDAIYELNVTEGTYVKITLDPKSTTYTSLSLFDGCPDTGALIDDYLSGYSTAVGTIEAALPIGTYYVMIDTWPSPDCIPEYDLTIEALCPAPTDIQEFNLTQTSADIQWTAGGFETSWNLKINEAVTIDPLTELGDIVENAIVLANPEYSITATLTAETDYYVYVQAACGSDWTQYMFTTPGTCPIPTGLTASTIGETTATLTWNELGISDWVIEVSSTPLTDPDTQDGDIANNVDVIGAVAEYYVTGLSGNTTYYWYVKSACGSDWSAEAVFTTECGAFDVPFIEPFNDGPGVFPVCWTRPVTYGTSPIFPSTDDTFASPPYSLKFQSSTTEPTYAVTPAFVEDINNLMAEFKLKAENITSSGVMEIGVMSDANDITTFELVQTITPTNTDWTDYTIYFDATTLSGTNNYIAFKHVTNAYNYYYWLDNLQINLIPACPTPINVYADNITATSADLNWTQAGTCDTWNIKVSTTAINPVTTDGDIIANESTMIIPYALSGLEGNTTYYFYVQADCGGETSNWSVQSSFTTQCEAYSVPFTENFDTWGTGSDAFPDCWARPVTYGTSPVYPSCVSEQSTSSPNSLKFRSLTTEPTYAITPAISEDINNLMVSFNLRREGTSSGVIQVGVMSDPNNVTTFELVETINPSAGTWTNYEVMFNATTLSGPNNYIALKHNSDASNWYYWLDDLTVDLIPSCPKPTDLYSDNATTTSVDLNWTDNSTATSWNIKVSSQPIDPSIEDGDIVVNEATTSNPHTVSGLDHSLAYFFYVQANCGEDDLSYWSDEGMAFTECGIASVPYVQDFESAIVPELPNCTSIQNAGSGNDWFTSNVTSYGFNSNVLRYDYTSSTANAWFYTQEIELEAGTSYRLTFKYGSNSTYYNERLKVAYGTSAINTAMTNTIVDLNSISNDTPLVSESDFIPSVSGTYYFGFNCYSIANQYYLYVDDILIDFSPTCFVPTNLYSDNATLTSVDLNWTDDNSVTSWNIKVSSQPIDPSIEDGDIVANEATTSNPHTVSGLDHSSLYFFYVQANCGVDDLSLWSNEGMAFTECGSIENLPFTENFDTWGTGSDAFPHCWSRPVLNTATATTFPSCVGLTTSPSLPNSLKFRSLTTEPTYAITPAFASDINSLTVAFSLKREGTSSGVMQVGVMSDPSDASTFELVETIDPTDNNWSDYEVTFNETTLSGTDNYIAFRHNPTSNIYFYWLDDVTVFSVDPPAIDQINLNSEVTDVNVCAGDDLATAIAALAPQMTISDTESNEYLVDLAWTIDAYDANTLGDYNATGTFELPAGVSQSDPVTPLEIGATVTVIALPELTCPETMNVAVNTPVTFTGHTPTGGTFSGEGVTGETFDPNGLENGTYIITYTYTDLTTGCDNSCEFNVIVDIDISVTDITLEGIGIYPNPNKGEFTIDFSNIEGDVTYQVYDTKGSVIVQREIPTNGNTVEEVSVDLIPGIYYVKVVTTNQTYVEKLVIE